MPEPSYLFASLVFSSIGLGYFIYGRKQKHKIALYSGLGLMVYSYFIYSLLGIVAIGVVLMLLPKYLKL